MVALWQNNWMVEQLSHNPLVGPSESTLHALGSLATSDLTDLHQYWRVVASIFQCSGAQPQISHNSTIHSALAELCQCTVEARRAPLNVLPACSIKKNGFMLQRTVQFLSRGDPAGADGDYAVDIRPAHWTSAALSGAGGGIHVHHPGPCGRPVICQPVYPLHRYPRPSSCRWPHR